MGRKSSEKMNTTLTEKRPTPNILLERAAGMCPTYYEDPSSTREYLANIAGKIYQSRVFEGTPEQEQGGIMGAIMSFVNTANLFPQFRRADVLGLIDRGLEDALEISQSPEEYIARRVQTFLKNLKRPPNPEEFLELFTTEDEI